MVTFTKFPADAKFTDQVCFCFCFEKKVSLFAQQIITSHTLQYTVYTRETDFENSVKNVLNGCSIGQELKAVSPQPTMTDKDGKTSFQLTNTHTSDDKPPFIIGIQVIRTLATPGSDIDPEPIMYKLVTVGKSLNAPGRNTANKSVTLSLLTTVVAIIMIMAFY